MAWQRERDDQPVKAIRVRLCLLLIHANDDRMTNAPTKAEITSLDAGLLASFTASDGRSLADVLAAGPTLLVLLRHLGCTFAMEAGADLAAQRAGIEAAGVRLVLVHMAREADAARFFERYKLGDVLRIADADKRLYRAFGLERGSLGQLFGPRVIARGINAFCTGRHTIGKLQGDGLQMPGVFLMRGSAIVRALRHAHAGERPDYAAIAR